MIREDQLKEILKLQESLLEKQKDEKWITIIETRISLIKFLLRANVDPTEQRNIPKTD